MEGESEGETTGAHREVEEQFSGLGDASETANRSVKSGKQMWQ